MTELTLLAIESSYDETGVAIMRVRCDGADTSTSAIPEVEVLTDIVTFSMEQCARFGGVVPEIVSRAHLEALQPVVSEVHAQAAAKLDISTFIPDAVAAIVRPGLAGALLVGSIDTRAYTAVWDIPSYDINHLDGHVAVGVLDGTGLSNAVALLVLGGYTQLLRVQEVGHPTGELESTLDDTAGEAYDKVSRLLGLGYLDDLIIDKLTRQGNRKAIAFPRATICQQDACHDFSFFGLKTAVARYAEAAGKEGRDYPAEDVCASFQEAVYDILTKKAIRAVQDMGVITLLSGGDVAANSRLREFTATRATSAGITLHVPSIKLCADNSVMTGATAAYLVAAGAKPSGYAYPTDPSMPVEGPVIH